MMMALGLFVFELSTVSYQDLQRTTAWRHPSNNRVGNTPAYQFTGKDEETINLSGGIYPEITGYQNSLDMLRNMGDTGKQYILIEGTGKIYGLVVIKEVQETRSNFFHNGGTRKISFSISLTITEDTTKKLIGPTGQALLSLGGLFL
ncbi:oxidoreductase [Acinetobacter tandoii]|uniref:Oxidoreductase n=1 Tax=Acinetobacter tandoii TaxID=202954 RepID=A0A5N4WW02_9GAMM|nr:phage tail protein [Acinetobacter tandoii]KAB1859923.1 oxidoreductase [Acinetobacter tandoii]